eukprot:1176807-Prorocentrum_minimum.AAC.5
MRTTIQSTHLSVVVLVTHLALEGGGDERGVVLEVLVVDVAAALQKGDGRPEVPRLARLDQRGANVHRRVLHRRARVQQTLDAVHLRRP